MLAVTVAALGYVMLRGDATEAANDALGVALPSIAETQPPIASLSKRSQSKHLCARTHERLNRYRRPQSNQRNLSHRQLHRAE